MTDITHLTMTGQYAGEVYCGQPRGIYGAKYNHANVSALRLDRYRETVCAACLKVWDDAGADDSEGTE